LAPAAADFLAMMFSCSAIDVGIDDATPPMRRVYVLIGTTHRDAFGGHAPSIGGHSHVAPPVRTRR
jgi:hypothetical protein